jgi:hypothetical protein
MIKIAIIKKLPNGKYRLYSRKKDKSGHRRNLGTYDSLAGAKKREKAVQWFKHHSDDGMADDHATKNLDRLSNIATYLEEAGFIGAADKVYMAMEAMDGCLAEDCLIDPFVNTDEQMNIGGGMGFSDTNPGHGGPSLSMDAPQVVAKLVELSNKLDKLGLYDRANEIDAVIKSAVPKIKPLRPENDSIHPLKNIDILKEKIEDIPQMLVNIDKEIHVRMSKPQMAEHERKEIMYLMRKKTELSKELEEANKFLKSPVYEWGHDKRMRESEEQEEYEQNPDPFSKMQEEHERKLLGLTEEEYKQKIQKDREEEQRKADEEVESGFWDEQWKEMRKQQIEDASRIPKLDPESGTLMPDGTIKMYEANDGEMANIINKLDKQQANKKTEQTEVKEPKKQKEDAVVRSNGLDGTSVTDNQNCGMFQGFSDSYMYRGYGDLEGPYK